MPISTRCLLAAACAAASGLNPLNSQPPTYTTHPPAFQQHDRSAAAGELLPPALPLPASAPDRSLPPDVSFTPSRRGAFTPGMPQEARAMWVVRYSLLSARQVHAVVERAYRYHFNALMVQVRGRGDAYYQSSIEPRAKGLDDAPPGFDPLAQMVREAHARGIQVFAWMDMMLVWNGRQAPPSYRHVINRHPEWIDTRPDGSPMTGTDYEGQFLNPGIPGVRVYTVSVCRDLVRRYDVDGVHLDYIRYPAPELGYNRQCLEDFYATRHHSSVGVPESTLHAETRAHPVLWKQWKQQQVTELVQEIRAAIQHERPGISLSAAVWANLEDARENRMQDWPTWLRDGLVDFVCPMAYSTNTDRMAHQIAVALRLSHGRHIWAGIGAWQMPEASTAAKIEAVRRLGAQGICLFSYDGLTNGGEREDYLAALSHGPFRRPAAVPVMPWLEGERVSSSGRSPASIASRPGHVPHGS